MIIGTANGNKKAKSLQVQTASGLKNALAIWTMTASGLKRDPFGWISGTVTSLAATIPSPFDICAYDGSLYISSSSTVIMRIDLDTGIQTFFTYGLEEQEFSSLRGICEYDGYLYACERHRIWRVNIATATVESFCGAFSPGDQLGIGTAARFDTPTGICANSGYLYVTDSGNNKIKRVQISNANVTHFSGSGVTGSGDGTSSTATFSNPQDISYLDGYLYVTQISTRGLRTVDESNGSVSNTKVFATGADDDGFTGTCGYSGRVYWADITQIFSVGSIETSSSFNSIAGSLVSSGDVDGSGSSVRFDTLRGCFEYDGAIYMCDSGNSKIRKMT